MSAIVTVLGLAMALAVAPAGAKAAKSRTFSGCVEASHNQYELSTVTATKGKPRHYTLAGSQNFAGEVGHRVKVTGLVENGTIKVAKIEAIAMSCH